MSSTFLPPNILPILPVKIAAIKTQIIEKNLTRFAKVVKVCLGKDVARIPGAGAAGGLGAGLTAFCGARLEGGLEYFLKLTDAVEVIKGADIVVVGEGARVKGGSRVIQRAAKDVTNPERLGGIGPWLAEDIEKATGIEARAVVLGHVLRGGSPVFQDRILATRLGYEAVNRAANGERDRMIAWVSGEYVSVPIASMAGGPRLVSPDHPWIHTSRAMGAVFGE